MDQKQESLSDETRGKIILAVTELAKGIKIVGFYPSGHPALTQAIWKIISAIGIEMISVVIVNTFAMRGSMPATNWWCAQTKKLNTPVANVV